MDEQARPPIGGGMPEGARLRRAKKANSDQESEQYGAATAPAGADSSSQHNVPTSFFPAINHSAAKHTVELLDAESLFGGPARIRHSGESAQPGILAVVVYGNFPRKVMIRLLQGLPGAGKWDSSWPEHRAHHRRQTRALHWHNGSNKLNLLGVSSTFVPSLLLPSSR